MYEIDKIDLKIVNLLLEDGRKSASEIARQIGEVSERAVRYRIERMIEEDVIRLSAVVRPEALGLPIRADVCESYYLDKGGRNQFVWPEYGVNIKKRLTRFEAGDYAWQ